MRSFLLVLSLGLGVFANIIIVKRNFTSPQISRPKSYTELRDGVVITSKPVNFDHHEVKIRKVKLCQVCKCGLASKNRIVGGEALTYNKYTWIVAMTYFGRYFCAGSLINDRYVVTAGHCTNGFQKENIQVHFLNYSRDKDSPLKRGVAAIKRYKGYNPKTLNNDISLVKLSSRVSLSDSLRPICLPEVGQSWGGYEAKAVGWGATRYQGKPVSTLHEVTVPIMTNAMCRNTVYGRRITKNMLCAGYVNGGKDACQGDSGGPLMVANNSVHSLAGIVSWGAGCAARGKPGVYTRVTKFIGWIEENTHDGCYCQE
ncbi:unnamed protein product [Hermetia illucens]|uniref:Peptidase S1 domain-containing protein n=1 Tax=Hermetia illucens TaxID=343691 RepID=A0A7R8UN71_HERIL|nr:trypsin-1-like [Hermetia illucens]XP_037912375.1 trypsin-1-like [Hermetia illucens]CAD7083719.1 unnamed protein product [Hermetia illucens]